MNIIEFKIVENPIYFLGCHFKNNLHIKSKSYLFEQDKYSTNTCFL